MLRVRPLFANLLPVAGVIGSVVSSVGCSKYSDDCAHTGTCGRLPAGAAGAFPTTAGDGAGGQAGLADGGHAGAVAASGGDGHAAGGPTEAGEGGSRAGDGVAGRAGGGAAAMGGAATGGEGGASPPSRAGSAGTSVDGGAGGAVACDATASPHDEACVIDEEVAVFVSPIGLDENAGTREAPYKTLGHAIAQAHAASKRVYACATRGPYRETLHLADFDRVEVYGGFRCYNWAYTGQYTQIESGGPVAVRVENVEGLLFEDFSIAAADATDPGGSSAALWVTEATNVILRRVSLEAGAGADGARGANGYSSAEDESAGAGAEGNQGKLACGADDSGGPSSESVCGGEASGSIGGEGGDGGTDDRAGGSGSPGAIGDNDPDTIEGNGGAGETNAGWTCATGRGQDGAGGLSRSPAAGATNAVGALSSSAYTPTIAESGLDGTPGQGGGGGGGAKAPASCGAGIARTGASGGGGGGGGCGGKGGQGGQSGGGSFALVSYQSSVKLDTVSLTTSAGGAGGKGGTAQTGGAAGNGGSGGAKYSGSNAGCSGGNGGTGGDGGHGGGGAGGPSVGIAYVGAAPETEHDLSFSQPETGASGGEGGGDVPVASGKGAEGPLEAWMEWPAE